MNTRYAFLLSLAALALAPLTRAQCLEFDGVDDYVQVPNPALNTIGTGDFTVEAWIKGAEADQLNHARLVSNRAVIGAGFMFFFHGLWGGSSYKMLCIQLDGLNYVVINNGTYNGSLLDGTCHHVAATRANDSLFYYADGILFGSRQIVANPTAASTSTTLMIGNDAPDPYPFKGNISELRLWNYARTQAEIQASMNTAIPGTSPGLVGYWPLNDGAQTAADHTGTADGYLGSTTSFDVNDPIWSNNCCTVLPMGVAEPSSAGNIAVQVDPVTGRLIIDLAFAAQRLTISDGLGQTVLEASAVQGRRFVMDIDRLPVGVYVATATGSDVRRSTRFLKGAQ